MLKFLILLFTILSIPSYSFAISSATADGEVLRRANPIVEVEVPQEVRRVEYRYVQTVCKVVDVSEYEEQIEDYQKQIKDQELKIIELEGQLDVLKSLFMTFIIGLEK